MGELSSLKGTKISVLVDEAISDLIVVSFVHDSRVYRGVLLDTSKRNLPCGITHLNPAFNAPKPDDDLLFAVNQRYAYTDSTTATNISVPSTSTLSSSTTAPATNRLKHKIGKMTVRLRPRQVLCSKCKDICNENSESITRKRKATTDVQIPSAAAAQAAATPIMATSSSAETASSTTSPAKRSANAPVTRSAHAIQQVDEARKSVTHALSGNVNKLNIDNNKKVPLMVVANQNALNALNADLEAPLDDRKLKRVIITRKKSVGAANEKWENETNAGAEGAAGPASNTRTIKISYGPQGEGTVLKIPAHIQVDSEDEEDVPEENVVEEANVVSKTSRKAMKKAKKAKKKVTLQTTMGSPERYTSSYSIGSSSPRYTVGSASPRHGLGNNSPRFVPSLPPISTNSLEAPSPKKRKHKMKHKKKHKEDRERKHKDDEKSDAGSGAGDKCLTQKLSINLKRLSGTYTTTATTLADSTTHMISEEDERDKGKEDESSSDEVPDFPPTPLRMKLTVKNLNSALSAEGVQLIVGDVVWGKIQGFPWWPGKILTITNNEQGPVPQAHVSWYGSSTSSLIQCDQLSSYLSNFKARYNKRKRGPYKDAIKQASNEARLLSELKTAQESSTSTSTSSSATSPSRMIMLVPPALASPREINVIS